ncbi:PREDICTED: UPF0481 protein At3g47200-like [Nelumbo nucifera]|nr:PREDICTED: UPF0481 protein At3g47200-like [Nelumbo nucifera]
MEWTWAPISGGGEQPSAEMTERTCAPISDYEPPPREMMEWAWASIIGIGPSPPERMGYSWTPTGSGGSPSLERMECGWAPMSGSGPQTPERERNDEARGKAPVYEQVKDERHQELLDFVILTCGLRDNTKPPKSLSSIYRIQEQLGDINYVPQIVSIGPFYYKSRRLQGTRKQKNKYLKWFLPRNPNCSWEKTLDNCVKVLKENEENARRWYSEEIEFKDRADFVTMMLVDGCFLLELLCRRYRKNHPEQPVIGNQIDDDNDDSDGPISKKMLPRIRHDLLLLENQLPFRILELLFRNTIADISSISLDRLVYDFFQDIAPIQNVKVFQPKTTKHILHLLRKFMCDSSKLEITGKSSREAKLSNYSVTQLIEAGVKFRKKENADSFLDISFTNGVLEIPNLHVHSYTECLFRNLIAFEQYFPKCTGRITSYAFLMDSLINSREDVQYLYKKGIITHGLGSHEEVSVLFDNLRKGIFLHYFYYEDVCTDLNNHFENRWVVWSAIFKREHLKNPLTVVALIGATSALLFTFASSLFAMLSFFVHGP